MRQTKFFRSALQIALAALCCGAMVQLAGAKRETGADTGNQTEAPEAGGNRVSGNSRNRKLNPNLNLLSPGSIGKSKFTRLDNFELSVNSLESSILSAAHSRAGGSTQINMTKRLNRMTVEARAIQQQLRTPNSRRIDLTSGLSLIQQGFDYLKDGKNRARRGISLKKTDYRSFMRQHRRDLESLLKDGASAEEYARSEEQLYSEWLSDVVETNLRKCDNLDNQNTREAYESIIHGFSRLRTAIRRIKQSGVKIQEKRQENKQFGK